MLLCNNKEVQENEAWKSEMNIKVDDLQRDYRLLCFKTGFYATADQIHKCTFDLEKNYEPYTEFEQDAIKKWMLINAVDRAFELCGMRIIYIRDDEYIRAEQIIRCEKM